MSKKTIYRGLSVSLPVGCLVLVVVPFIGQWFDAEDADRTPGLAVQSMVVDPGHAAEGAVRAWGGSTLATDEKIRIDLHQTAGRGSEVGSGTCVRAVFTSFSSGGTQTHQHQRTLTVP